MKEVTGTIFGEVLAHLVEAKYVKLEAYFADGTKIEADANKHKVVWAKRKNTYQKRVRQHITGFSVHNRANESCISCQ